MSKKPFLLSKVLLLSCCIFVASYVMAQDAPQENAKAGWRSKCETAAPSPNRCNEFTFDATSSHDPNNKKITYAWDFGDGSTSDQPVVKHVYEKAGEYTATLTVTNNSGVTCDTDVSSQVVKVNTPPRADFSGPENACLNDTVTFDAGASTDDTPGEMTYAWDLGDGTKGEGRSVTKMYDKSGTYKVRLTVDDNAQTACSMDSITKSIVVTAPPKAYAGRDISRCVSTDQPLTVTLDGSATGGSGKDMTYSWNLGDGTTKTGSKVTHTYDKPGNYTARLTVSDSGAAGCGSDTASVNISLNSAPMANAGDDVGVCLGESVTFDGSASKVASGTAATYRWDFGDGENAEGATVKHTYQKGGTYRAMLTVDDGSGSQCAVSTDVKSVTVNAPPVAKLADVAAGCVGDSMAFDASETASEGGSLKYTWDFGDGTVKEGGARVTHVYEKGGNYTVRVTVDKTVSGCDTTEPIPCSRDMASINVKINTPPIANAGPNLVCCANKLNSFDGTGSSDADGDTLTYMWNFGDGETAEGATTTHTYTKAGTYKITMTVDDNTGSKCSTSSDGFVATVLEQPVSVIKVR